MKDIDFGRLQVLIETALKERPTGDDWLDYRYSEQVTIVGHSQPYYRLFHLISQELKPNVVVELGGWQGTAAAHFAAGTPEATVITIDHHSDPGDDLNRLRMLEAVKQYPNITYLRGWTSPGFAEEYPKTAADGFRPGDVLADVKEILGDRKIDILFIDSWHEGRYLKRDWDYYSPLLADPALVICDDVLDTNLFVDMISAVGALPGDKIFDGQVHPGVPIGFIKYGLSADRPAGRVEPKAVVKPKTRTAKTSRKRAA